MNTTAHKPAHPYKHFNVRVVLAKRGGEYVVISEFGAGDKLETIRKCEELQQAFDDDCEPVRVYMVDDAGMVEYAACGHAQDCRARDPLATAYPAAPCCEHERLRRRAHATRLPSRRIGASR